jgi:hypothetical protein
MKLVVSRPLILIVPVFVLATTGCDSNPKPEPCTTFPVVEERVKASEFDGIDLLVVIDTSATSEQQSALAQGVYSISNVLTMPLQSEFPPVESLRLAVVSSDMGLQWGGGEVGGSSADISGCDNNRGRDGEFLTITAKSITLNGGVIPCEPDGGQCPAGFSCDDGFCTPDGAVGYAPCDVFSGSAEMVDSTLEPNSEISTHLACLATQENEGCGLEQPLEAAVRALETHPELILPNHLLGVLIIAPDDDCSISLRLVMRVSIPRRTKSISSTPTVTTKSWWRSRTTIPKQSSSAPSQGFPMEATRRARVMVNGSNSPVASPTTACRQRWRPT